MDPKASSSLDPALQQAYDRVMGVANTLTPSPSAASPVADTTNSSVPASSAMPSTPTPLSPSMPSMPNISPTTPPVMASPVMPSVPTPTDAKPQAFVAKTAGKGTKISPTIWVLGGVVFLAVYTIVWIKVFNLPVPFINQ